MTDAQRTQIQRLRAEGLSYGKISQALDISENTVKTYCRRHGLGRSVTETTTADEEKKFCIYCSIPIIQIVGRKEKRFCSDRCRNRWWNEHLDQVNRKANYEYVCPCCNKPFTAYGNKNRKYCSHECYIEDRFGGGNRD